MIYTQVESDAIYDASVILNENGYDAENMTLCYQEDIGVYIQDSYHDCVKAPANFVFDKEGNLHEKSDVECLF